jgi:hypothetical protein
MLCFSSKWSNPVQWSHYADRHRGLCLGFDVPDALLSSVTYCSKRLKPDPKALAEMQAEGPAAHEMMLKLVTTKFRHWRYEHEQRLFIGLEEKDARGLYFYGFSAELVLREIIFGSEATISRADIKSAIGRTAAGFTAFKAQLAFRSFRVVKQKRDDLWN